MLFCTRQLAALTRPGCVTETVTVRTTPMRTTARCWCASCLTTCVLPTNPSVCLRKSCAMELTIVQMAPMRNFVVKRSLHSNTFSTTHLFCSFHVDIQSTASLKFSCLLASKTFHLCFLHADLCSLDNGGCSHNCSIIPGQGFMCSCPLGMELGADNKTCQIQSFCAKHLKCSQNCEQEKSSVKCSCYKGWELEADMESCKSTGELNYLLYYKGMILFQVM